MPEAAHKTHQVAHSLGMAALIGGAIVGGVLAAGFIVLTGGTGAIVIASAVATGVSAGGGLGKMVGSHFSGTPSGPIMFNCVDSVLIEGFPAATVGSLTMCTGAMMGPPHPSSPIVQGSSTVFIGGKPAARKGDKLACSAKVNEGCSSVIIGGETVTVAPLNPEVPEWVDWGLMGLGMLGGFGLLRAGGMSVLGAATRVGGGTAGGMGGSMLAGYGAEQMGYEPGSWGHDLATVGGGMLGGYGGYKGGERYYNSRYSSVYRAQGGTPPNASYRRVEIDADGNASVNGKGMLYMNLDDKGHAVYFYNKRGGSAAGGEVTKFEIPRSLADEIKASAVRQDQGKQFPGSPQISDPTKSPSAYGLPKPWIDRLNKEAIPGSGRILKPKK